MQRPQRKARPHAVWMPPRAAEPGAAVECHFRCFLSQQPLLHAQPNGGRQVHYKSSGQAQIGATDDNKACSQGISSSPLVISKHRHNSMREVIAVINKRN